MKIATKLASFSLAQADILRRAMGKKNAEEMAMQKKNFIEGAQKNKIPAKKAEKLFDLMAKFAEYGFNKSHSAAYALIAFQTAYLKAHYPVEFMAALLSSETGNSDKILRYLGGVPGEEDRGPSAGREREPPGFHRGGGEDPVRAGRGEECGPGRHPVHPRRPGGERELYLPGGFLPQSGPAEGQQTGHREPDQMRGLRQPGPSPGPAPGRAGGSHGVGPGGGTGAGQPRSSCSAGATPEGGRGSRVSPSVPEWPENQRLAFEKETLGFYLTGHPLSTHAEVLQRFTTMDTLRVQEAADGQEVIIGGVVNALKEINTKKGDRMAFVTLEDLEGVVEVIIFSELYKNSSLLLKGEDPVFIKGRVDAGEENVKIIASEVLPFEQAVGKLTTSVHLRLRSDGLRREDLEAIREIFQDCRGNCPAYLHLLLPGKERRSSTWGMNGS